MIEQAAAQNSKAFDKMEAAYAPVCCSLVDDVYTGFCESLFDGRNYNSTGMIEAHSKWIGTYDILVKILIVAANELSVERTAEVRLGRLHGEQKEKLTSIGMFVSVEGNLCEVLYTIQSVQYLAT